MDDCVRRFLTEMVAETMTTIVSGAFDSAIALAANMGELEGLGSEGVQTAMNHFFKAVHEKEEEIRADTLENNGIPWDDTL